MGHGVAQVSAEAGYQVLAIESSQDAANVGMKRIEDSLSKVISRAVKKGQYDESEGKSKFSEILGNASYLKSLINCDHSKYDMTD